MDLIWQWLAGAWASLQHIDVNELIDDLGWLFYLITFVWTYVEGETFVIIAGAAAAVGKLNIYLLIAVAAMGSFCGDQTYFYIGRRYGRRLLTRFPRWQPGVDAALGMLHKYNTGFILSFRFIYGVRNFASFAMGMSEIPWPRFFFLNLIAAWLWAVIFAGTGYLLGHAFEHVIGDITKSFGFVIIGLIIFFGGLTFWMNRKAKQKMLQEAKALGAAPVKPGS